MRFLRFLILGLFLYPLLNVPQALGLSKTEESKEVTPSLVDQFIQNQLQQLETSKLESSWEKARGEYKEYFKDKQPGSFSELLTENFSIQGFFTALGSYLLQEILNNAGMLGMIIVLTVFSLLLKTVQAAFVSEGISKIAYAVIFMMLLIMAMESFGLAIGYARQATSQMIELMTALVPILLTLLTSMGNLGSAALFHPFVIFMINTISVVIYTIVLPLFLCAGTLNVVSNISDKYKLTQLASMLHKGSAMLLSGMLTVFMGVMSMQGATASVADGITIRTAKYVTGNFIPVVGRTLADVADTVAGASLLLKNTVGLVGVLILLFICIFPACKILALMIIYKLAAALLQPLGENPIINTLSTISNSMLYVFFAVAVVGLMFFLSLVVIILSGNISLMMR